MNSDGDLLDRLAMWLFAILFWVCVAAVVGLVTLVQFGWVVALLATAGMTAFLAPLFFGIARSLGYQSVRNR